MSNSRTNESLPFSQLPQHLYASSIGTSTNKHALAAIPERAETPNLFTSVTEKMNYCYNNTLVNNGNVSFPPRIVQPAEGKKDKHSKIVTARGPRDRRMRLSIEVSKKFFGLQDMLGFDRASKTLDWLLTQSKLEIEELSRKQNQVQNVDLVGQAEKSARELRRAEARARARERTRNKQSLSFIRSECSSSTTKEDLEMDRHLCSNEESGHMSSAIISLKEASNEDLLLPCPTTENTWEASWQP